VVDSYSGKANLGVYSLATQLSQMLWILPQTVASVLYAYASSTTEKEAITHTIQIKQVVFVLTMLFAIIGLTLSYFLIPVLYGNEFLQAFNLTLNNLGSMACPLFDVNSHTLILVPLGGISQAYTGVLFYILLKAILLLNFVIPLLCKTYTNQ